MKRSTMAAIGGTAAGLAGGVASMLAVRKAKQPRPHGVAHHRADELTYKEVLKGVTQAVLWGDPSSTAYAAFTRFAPGQRNPLHKHSNDITIVVLSGAYIYKTDEGEIRVGPRSAFVLPAGTPHESRGDPIEGALFFETSTAHFDMSFLE